MAIVLKIYITLFLFISFVFTQCDDFTLGDANNDSLLDVVDIVAMVDLIFDDNQEHEIYLLDVNQDAILDVIDIVILINVILNNNSVESNINDISYDFNNIEINWDRSLDYGFVMYSIFYSNFFDNEELLLYSTNDINNTSATIENLQLKEQNFFWVVFENYLGCEIIGQQYFYELPYKSYSIDNLGNITSTEFNVSDFQSAFQCVDCHQEHVDEWSESMHAYTMNSPLFFSYKEENKNIHPSTGEKFCMQCHNPVSYLSGTDLSMYNSPNALQSADISQVLKEGITCDVCHTKTGLSETVHGAGNMSANAIYKMYPNSNIKFGSIQNPVQNDYHQSYYLPTYQSSQFCLPCHDLVINNIEAEVTFTEWNRIPGFSMFGGVSCQNCHMPLKDDGTHDHRFVGVDLDLAIPINENPSYGDVEELLSTSANINFNILGELLTNSISASDTLTIPLSVTSETAHNFPSGTSFNREAWVEIQVLNNENLIFSSGLVNNSQSLDYSDENLLFFTSFLYDENNNLTNNVTQVDSMANYSLLPYQSRYKYYNISLPNELEGDLLVTAKLLFRSFSPHFILQHHPEFIENLPIFEVDSISQTITVE